MVDPATADDAAAGTPALLGSLRTLRETAQRIRDDLELVTSLDLPVVESATSTAGDITLALAADATLGDEGYELSATDRIAISAPATDGIFYGAQSLLQVLRQAAPSTVFPQGEIRDWPDLTYRAEHFDVSRRYMSVEDIQDEIRRAAWSKLNVIQLMFNQANAFRLYSPDYAAAAPTDPGQRYTQADIAAIEEVAADYHVTIVPEVQNPTKMQPIAGLGGIDRSLASQCGDPSTIDFTDPAVVTWFQDLLDEFIPWFSGPYIHLGNDEVPTSLASCSYLTSQLGAGETIDDLQEEYIASLKATVEARDKTAMIWVNNTRIRPGTDVLIMNFGAESVAASMRSLGYQVVDSAYKSGPYDRFYISPSDFEGKVVPRGDIYAWTPPAHANNFGQVLAMWGDDLFFSETDYFIDMFDGRREELAERTWNTAAAGATFATFSSLIGAIGRAPGVAALPSVPETTDGQPIHAYDFNSTYTPTAATHYPGYWKLSLADSVGTLHGNGWIFTPNYPVAGRDGNGLGFGAAASQSLNLGGYRIAGAWSTAFWIKRTANSTNTVLLRDMDHAIKVEQSGTANRFGISTYGGANYTLAYTAPLNTWAHVTITSDSGGTSLYADGVLVDSIAQQIPLPLGGIGGRRSFGGVLDDLLIYAEKLTALEVAALYGTYAVGTPVDLAAGKTATASSVKNANPDRVASKAFDGDSATRWGSEYADPTWVQVDLGQSVAISGVRLNWESAYGKSYKIQVSSDGTTWTDVYSTTTGDGGVDEIAGLSATGRYVRMYGTERGTTFGYSLFDFNVYGSPADLAVGKMATASSVKSSNPDRAASKAFDGDPATRWGSEYVDPTWIQVDLGTSMSINGVRLNWESAFSKSYQVQVSSDGTTWTDVYSTTTGDGGVDQITGLSATGRYVRMYGTERGTGYGYSLWDFNVYGGP
ncbi:hypothetical protein ASD65_10720 [Microbacterium sp. Root61]|nr:hypothetical protein ASD65_10720 [Microbacterium sp. Root61]